MQYLYFRGPTTQFNGEPYELMQMEHHILLQRRKELKMTQQQVADKAGIQLRQYQRLEKGERNISGSSGRIMLSICEALMLDPYLFLGKGNDRPENKSVILPPIETQGIDELVIPSIAYYSIVSAIPRGMVCTGDDLMSCLRKSYGVGAIELKTDRNSVELYSNDRFPFWRVVSQKGYLINSFYCSKERQKDKLEGEGVKINKVGENESYRVEEFDYRRFNTNYFKITVLKTDKQIYEQFKELMV